LAGLTVWLAIFGSAVYVLAGWPPALPQLPTALPTWISVEVWLRSPALGIDVALPAARFLAWLMWGWTCATVLLRVGVNALELATNGATWVRSFRLASDWLTLPLVRRAVDASLAGVIMARVAMPFPVAAASLPATSASEVARTIGTRHGLASLTKYSLVNGNAHLVFGAEQDVTEQGDSTAAAGGDELVYTVRHGDTWWGIAERFYGDGSRAEALLESNIGRLQGDGRQITRRGFIYPGWTVSVPEPIRGIVEEHDGQRWYTVARDDTLSGIAEDHLGDPTRWPELFELNRGQAMLDERHVLQDPSLIWPGLVLQLPEEETTTDGDDGASTEPPPSVPSEPPADPVEPSPSVSPAVQTPVAPVPVIPIVTPLAAELAASPTAKATEPTPAA
jgi:nucleoid-associated protein YgaU